MEADRGESSFHAFKMITFSQTALSSFALSSVSSRPQFTLSLYSLPLPPSSPPPPIDPYLAPPEGEKR